MIDAFFLIRYRKNIAKTVKYQKKILIFSLFLKLQFTFEIFFYYVFNLFVIFIHHLAFHLLMERYSDSRRTNRFKEGCQRRPGLKNNIFQGKKKLLNVLFIFMDFIKNMFYNNNF